MDAVHQLKEWYQNYIPPTLEEVLQEGLDLSLLEDLAPEDVNLENYAWLRHRRYDLEASRRHRSFSQAGWLEVWEKSRLFSLEEVERMDPSMQQELASCMVLNTAIDCDDSQARVKAALAFSPGHYTRPLIRKLFRDLSGEEGERARHHLRETICQEGQTEEALRLKLEIWAAHPGGTMTTALLKQLLDRCFPSETLLRALLQCAGKNRHDQKLVMEWLQETDFDFCSPRLQQAMMDYCGIQATPHTHDLLLAWKQELKTRTYVEDWIPEYLALTIDDCQRQLAHHTHQQPIAEPGLSEKTMTIAQFMFYGDLMLPGKANSGGIATLLRTLGDALSEEPGIKQVYTFMMMPCDERAGTNPLTTYLSPGHTLVRVPVFFDETCSPELFQEKEYDIGHTLDRMLHLLQIQPDIYHMRYADNASLAAALLAKRKGKKAVFTLTPDPHRNIKLKNEDTTQSGERSPLQNMEGVKTLLIQLNKVRAADDILDLCDGVVGIGTPELAPPLTAYFPQMKKDIRKRRLKFRMIPEGIHLKDNQEEEERLDPWRLFSAADGKYRLAQHRKKLPVMLTLGRLDPVKGQITLLEAWSDNQLWQTYNLVLIGGDLEKPDEKEKNLLRDMDEFMETHPHLKGSFCHLGRMDNEPLRRLQRGLAAGWTGDLPPLYIAPSRKEEFGLSIIEAMAAGLVAIGPRAGGVGSYVTDSYNGFILETDSPFKLREGLVEVLLKANRKREEWAAIAARGKDTVETRFDIHSIARKFTHFYQKVGSDSPPISPRILFLIPPFYSHFNPMMTLAKCFSREGWETIVGTGEGFKQQVEAAHLTYEKVVISRNANTGIAGKTRQAEEEQERLEAFFQATHQGPEETLLVQSRHRKSDMLSDPEGLMSQIQTLDQEYHPDLWVVDQLSYGATLALHCLGLPFVTFCPPHPFSIPQSEGLFGVPCRWPKAFHPDPGKLAALEKVATDVRDYFTAFFNESLQQYGQQPVKNAFSLTSPLAVVYNYPPISSVKAQQEMNKVKMIYAGYCFEPKKLSSDWEEKLGAFRQGFPRILLSFGTFLSRRSDLLEKCVRWIRQAYPASSLVVAAGGNLEDLRHLREEKVLVEDFLPQAALYPEVDLVIHHGGNNTFTESLYHGKPMIIFPFSSDQFHIAADGEEMGVAQVMVPNEVTRKTFLRGMEKTLSSGTLERTIHWQEVLRQRGPAAASREVIHCWESGDWK